MIEQNQFMAAWFESKFGVVWTVERQEGQGLVEYALILVLVSVVAAVTLATLGTKITGVFTTVTGKLG